ncbi:MAG: MGMT family protein [Betaproteobacteria bacterium]|nr:MGMT family protein [Betaproteobacteria bacterium]MDE2056665.1 MGMT family protein [Betaproteobacteria bacterium]
MGVVCEGTTLLRIDVKSSLEELHLFLLSHYPLMEQSNILKTIADEVIHLIHNPTYVIHNAYRLEGTVFQQKVWHAILTIPVGSVKTYQVIAQEIRHTRAVRAVGTACGANPLPFIVPCHRVVGSSGKLGGFGLGIEFKRELLAKEGITYFL